MSPVSIYKDKNGRIRVVLDEETFKGLHTMLEEAEISRFRADSQLDDAEQKLLHAVINFDSKEAGR